MLTIEAANSGMNHILTTLHQQKLELENAINAVLFERGDVIEMEIIKHFDYECLVSYSQRLF